ncbi:MAG: glycine cleavage system protein GcvH [Ferrimicrobium sp.]
MNYPAELRYTSDHEWVNIIVDVATVGITDYAQDALGDVVYVGLPTLDTVVSAGDPIAEVESTKSVSDIYAPVSGRVVAVNDNLREQPEWINTDPYEAGWICKIALDSGTPAELLDANAYVKLVTTE